MFVMLSLTQLATFLIIKHRICKCTYAQITLIINIYYSDLPTVREALGSAPKSWIGQTVTLTCVSDGVPTPTTTWYKPDGSQIKSVRATQNTVNVKMKVDQDFGSYLCNAAGEYPPNDYKIVKVQQISKSSSCLSVCY